MSTIHDNASTFRPTRLEELFVLGLDVPAHERDAWIARSAGDDAALSGELAALLAADAANADGAISGPGPGSIPGAMPDRVGDYRLRRELASGAMGVVYEALHEATGRPTALKLLRLDFLSRKAEVRFQLEAEMLARLDHDGIARVHDAGVAIVQWCGVAQRRPFLAMELIEGSDLKEFASNLSAREKLALVARIARAVSHAHQRGIIHRDLKPTNILVTADGRPKIVDFGIARLMHNDDGSACLTQEGQIVGSLRYMSPEQARGDLKAIDTRTDVFSLGVILYELLAGAPPHDLPMLPTPEALITLQTQAPPLRARARGIETDVEAIVAKAMMLEPAGRYAGAAAFAQDIEDFLADRPTVARPPSLLDHARRIIRRRPALTAAASVGAAALLIGGGVMTRQAILLSRASHDKDTALIEKTRAAEESSIAAALLGQVAAALTDAGPQEQERVLKEIERMSAAVPDLANQPLLQAQIQYVVGRAYDNLGRPELGLPRMAASAQTRLRVLGENDVRTAESLLHQGNTLIALGRFAEALPPLEHAVRCWTALRGPNDSVTFWARWSTSLCHIHTGQCQAGFDGMRSLISDAAAALGPDSGQTVAHIESYTWELLRLGGDPAAVLSTIGAWGPSPKRFEEAPRVRRMRLAVSYAGALNAVGRYQDAQAFFEWCAPIVSDDVPPGHAERLALATEQSATLVGVDRASDAAALLRAELAANIQSRGTFRIEALVPLCALARACHEAGLPAERDEALEKAQAIVGADQPPPMEIVAARAHIAMTEGRFAEAADQLGRVADWYDSWACDTYHYHAASARLRRAQALARADPQQGAPALIMARDAIDVLVTRCGADSPTVQAAMSRMAELGR